MTAGSISDPLTVEQLLEGIKHLSPTSLREFQRRFRAWRGENSESTEASVGAREGAPDRLSVAEERHLKRLIARSERGTLTPEELAEYKTLARRAEQVSAAHIQDLAKLHGARKQATPGVGKKASKKGGARGA